MKKKILAGCIVIMVLSLGISVYAYITNQKISNYIEDNASLRKKILVLTDLRTNVVKASQTERLYILTQKNSYKKEFDESITNLYKEVDNLYKDSYINSSEKKKLVYTLDEFKNVSANYSNHYTSNNYTTIDDSVEKLILDYNKSQLNILNEITLDITSDDETFTEKDSSISSNSNFQTKAIQGVSSAITVIVSGFLYYFKKKLNKDNVDIEDIINYLTNIDDEDKVTTPPPSKVNNESDLSTISDMKDKIIKSEVLLSNANLLYKESVKLKNQCEKTEIILSEIDSYMKKLRVKIDDISDYPTSAQKIILDDIDKQLIELKILFKSLPNYNDFIIDISNNMLDKDK